MKGGDRLLLASAPLLLGGAWLALLLSIGLLLNKTYLDSDSLFLDDLMTDLLQRGGDWRDWRFPPAPAYVPDVLLYALGYFLLPTAPVRIFFVSACQAAMLALAAQWLAKKIRPGLSAPGRAAIVALVAAATIVAARSGMWLYFYSTNNHFSTLLFGLLALGFLLVFVETPKFGPAAGLVLSVVAAQISSTLFTIALVIPVLLTLAVCGHLLRGGKLGSHSRQIWSAFGLIVAGYELAKLIDAIVTYNEPLATRVSLTPELAGRSLKLIMKSTALAFSPDNPGTLLFSLFVAASFGLLAFRFLHTLRIEAAPSFNLTLPLGDAKTGDWRLAGCGAVLACMVPVNALGSILSGGIIDLAGYRYFILPLALAPLLAIVVIDRRVSGRALALAVAGLTLACLGISMATLNAGDWRQAALRGHSMHGGDQVAACIENLRGEGVALKSGLADYFYSRGVAALLPPDQTMVTVTDSLIPNFWMSSIAPFTHPDRLPPRQYNFVVLRDASDLTDVTVIDLGKVAKLLPPGFTLYPCPAAAAQIAFYPDEKLDEAFERYRNFFLFTMEERNDVTFYPSDLSGAVGKLGREARVASEPIDGAGFLSLGPWRDLRAGRYQLILAYSRQSPDGAPPAYWNIGRFNATTSISLFQGDLRSGENLVAEAMIDVPAGGLKAVQFRIWFPGKGRLSVESVKLSRVAF